MMHVGGVSVTFRKLLPQEITALAAQAGLEGIEWGGDIHVPHGDLAKAREVGRLTRDAGLRVAAYGSYYHVGCETPEELAFERVLETAVELQAPSIRVWAGDRASQDADGAWWKHVVEESHRISALAREAGITLSFEYHGNTLTDTGKSARRLMRAISRDNVSSYWQPPVGLEIAQQIEGLVQIAPWLGNIHVFWWKIHDRLPLADGIEAWRQYMDVIRPLQGDRFCLLEFVRGDDPGQFLADAAALRQFL